MEQLVLFKTEPVEVPDKAMEDKIKGHAPGGGLEKGHTKSKGNGRPKKVTEIAYLEVFKEVVDLEAYRVMLEKHLQKAQAGDFKAFQEILRQAQGTPKQQIVVESAQLEALARIQELINQ